MRVCVATHHTADSIGGAADRVNGIVDGLEALGHEVQRLILPIRKPLHSQRWRPYWYLRPSARWLDEARAALRRSDLMIASFLPVAHAVVGLVDADPRHAPIVYDAHNDDVRLWRITGRRGAKEISRMQQRVVCAVDAIWIAGTEDASSLRSSHPGAFILSVPNGAAEMPDLSESFRGPGSAFAYGSWNYAPNRDGLLRLAAGRSHSVGRFHLFGDIDRGLHGEIVRRVSNSRPEWSFEGWVSTLDRLPAIAGGPAVIPVWTGGGTKLRAVQLAAMGVPIHGPVELTAGLPAWFRDHVHLSEDPDELLEAALTSSERDWTRAQTLRDLVQQLLSWSVVLSDALSPTLSKLGLGG